MSFPLIYADYPDPDIIRVDDTYYMISTTMHFFPGGEILKSKDLMNWELCCCVFDVLGEMPERKLDGGHIYGKGMWAGSLRYHNGLFYLLFACNESKESCCFTAENAEGPWTRRKIDGFYYDCSLFFDEGRAFIVHGQRDVFLTEMEPDLSRPKEGGLNRQVLADTCTNLGFEGNHMYKVNGKYYIFSIHWPSGHMRQEACHMADSLDAPFTGGDILEEDLGFHRMGIAQGGIVDTPEGEWYAFLFQDRGAAGRMPALFRMKWENDMPVILVNEPLTIPEAEVKDRPENRRQWNHEPDLRYVAMTPDKLTLTSFRITPDLEMTPNMLTQRTFGTHPVYDVTIDASALNPGDRAGLLALQGCFAGLAIERTASGYQLLRMERVGTDFTAIWKSPEAPTETVIAPLESPVISFRLEFDFEDMRDTVRLFARSGAGWAEIGGIHQLYYRLDHFTGVRPAVFLQSTKEVGGSADFIGF